MPRVLIALPLPEDLLARIAATATPVMPQSGLFSSPAELKALAPGLDGAVITANTRIDASLVALAPRLRVVSNCAVGLDNIDLDACGDRVAVCNTPGVQDVAVAELAVALVMALARNLVSNDAYVRSGEWQRKRAAPLGMDIRGKRLGLIGFGGIGSNTARLARALGMEVVAFKPRGLPADGFVSRNEVLATSDFVSLHLPLTAATRGSMGASDFARMKRGSFLINTARGAIIDEAALLAALRSGHLAGAALDVMAEEPMAPDHPLCALPNVILQPHAAGATRETRRGMEEMAVANLLAALERRQPPVIVNPNAIEE